MRAHTHIHHRCAYFLVSSHNYISLLSAFIHLVMLERSIAFSILECVYRHKNARENVPLREKKSVACNLGAICNQHNSLPLFCQTSVYMWHARDMTEMTHFRMTLSTLLRHVFHKTGHRETCPIQFSLFLVLPHLRWVSKEHLINGLGV